jgi:ketosteroid isomerase-like protein
MKLLWFLFLIVIAATAQSARQAQIVPEDLDPTTANARPTVEDQSLPCNGFLSLSDKAAIKAIMEAYRTAWLRGDASGVLQTFTSSSVLSPAQGADPVVGLQEIEKYWWPSNVPETKILQLDISVDQMEGDGCLAFARGSDTVAWSTSQKGNVTKTWHKGKYLNVMKKMPDGNWRILQHMWDDQPNESF